MNYCLCSELNPLTGLNNLSIVMSFTFLFTLLMYSFTTWPTIIRRCMSIFHFCVYISLIASTRATPLVVRTIIGYSLYARKANLSSGEEKSDIVLSKHLMEGRFKANG